MLLSPRLRAGSFESSSRSRIFVCKKVITRREKRVSFWECARVCVCNLSSRRALIAARRVREKAVLLQKEKRNLMSPASSTGSGSANRPRQQHESVLQLHITSWFALERKPCLVSCLCVCVWARKNRLAHYSRLEYTPLRRACVCSLLLLVPKIQQIAKTADWMYWNWWQPWI